MESMRKVVDRKTESSAKRPANPCASRPKKLSPAGTKIVSAFQEAIDVMRSGVLLPGRLTVGSFHAEFVRPSYGAADVRRVRDLIGDEPGCICVVSRGRPQHGPLLGARHPPSQFNRATVHVGD